MMQAVAKFISYLFHPIFVILYMLIILWMINPFVFGLGTQNGIELLLISVFFLTVFFPIFSTFLMKFLDLISSVHMEERKDRIIPLVATSIFYLWLFMNIRQNPGIPESFNFFVLGATISLFLALMINGFIKISLHTIGMGGMVMALILIKYHFSYSTFTVDTFQANYIVNTNLVLYAFIIMAGAVGTSRLILKSHDTQDIYLGYTIGAFSQLVAFFFVVLR